MRCIVKSQHLDGKSASLDRGDSHSSASFSGSEAPGQSCDDSPRSSLEIDDDAGDALAACSSQPAGESSARRAARDRDDGASRQSQDYNPRRTDARVADRAVARRSMDSSARPAAADEQNPSWRIKALRSLGSSSHLVDRDSARAGSLRPVAGAAAEVPVPVAPPRREKARAGGAAPEVGGAARSFPGRQSMPRRLAGRRTHAHILPPR